MNERSAGTANISAAQDARWHVTLLGRFQLSDGTHVHSRLATRATTALLARLALWPQRDHAREELIELLWPGVDRDTGLRRLRQALSMLRQVLEPPHSEAVPVLQADRSSLRLVGGALHCDVHEFERCVRSGRTEDAMRAYGGDLLPGFYDEWILEERQRLLHVHDNLPAVPQLPPALQITTRHEVPSAGDSSIPAHSVRTAFSGQRTDRSSLPIFLTRYVPSERQLRLLFETVLSHRWVTVTGAGGSGKTRLVVELARQMHANEMTPAPVLDKACAAPGRSAVVGNDVPFDRVLHVSMVAASTFQQGVDTIAKALRIVTSNATPDAIFGRLTGWKTLLVLDNVEQLAGILNPLLVQLTESLPALHLLLTSRRVLAADGEHLFAVAPLAVPLTGASVREVAASPAVALFAQRATAVRADFRVGVRNHAVVAELVRVLEGMPLAIELAASRLRSVSPAEMLDRLQPGRVQARHTPRLDLLARPSERGRDDPRHSSMERTIDWSWRQLDEPQRRLLGALTVFGGGCGLGLLTRVSGGGAEVAWVLDQLVAHSMVQVISLDAGDEPDGDGRLFRLFEPVREYAAARLDANQMAQWRARHRAEVIAWAKALPRTPALAEVRARLHEIAAALQSAATDDAGDDAIRLLLALGHTLEDVELPHAALADASAAVEACRDDLLRSRGHTAIGPLLYAAGKKEAAMHHVEAGLKQASSAPAMRARALYGAARLRWRSDLEDHARVLPLIDEAQALAEAAGDAYLAAGLLSLRAFVTHVQDGTPDAALALHRRALRQWEVHGNRHAVNIGRFNVAVFEFHCGRAEVALAQLEAIGAEAQVLSDWRRVAVVDDARGNVLSAMRRWPEAAEAYRASLGLAWRTMSIYNLAYAFWNLPRALAHLRKPALALTLACFAEQFWVDKVGSLTRADERYMRLVRRLAARQLSPRACATAWARGRLLTVGEAMALASDNSEAPTTETR